MDKKTLLNKLDKATDRGARLAISKGIPVKLSSSATLVGNLTVELTDSGMYSIVLSNRKCLYENISLYDIAIIIAQRYATGEMSVIQQVLKLEEKYAKHHTDMLHYLYCLRLAKDKHNLARMAVLEDKFQKAELSAKHARDSISIFKRMKY